MKLLKLLIILIIVLAPAMIIYFIAIVDNLRYKLHNKLQNELLDKEWREYTSLIEKDKGLAELLEILQYMVGISNDALCFDCNRGKGTKEV